MRYLVLLFAAAPLVAAICSDSPWSADAHFVAKEVGAVDDVLELDNQSFDEFVQQDIAVVKFFAEWCGPCRRYGPKFAVVAKEFDDIVPCAKLNISTSAPTAAKYHVKAVPTTVIYSRGVEVKRHTGSLTEEKLKEFILSVANDR